MGPRQYSKCGELCCFSSLHRRLPAPSLQPLSVSGKASLVSRILLAYPIVLCPPALLHLIIGPSEGFCFVLSLIWLWSPHPTKTTGSTLSISLWPWPNLGSLEIVLNPVFSFHIILSFSPEFISMLPGSTASVSTSGPHHLTQWEPWGNKQCEARSQQHGCTLLQGRARLILLSYL